MKNIEFLRSKIFEAIINQFYLLGVVRKERVIIKENQPSLYWETEMADSKGMHKLFRKEIRACISCSKDDGELKDLIVIFL